MSLQELKNQAYQLSVSDRLSLVNAIIHSLEREFQPKRDRQGAAQRMRGLLKTDTPSPTDAEVASMLEERLVEKYLK